MTLLPVQPAWRLADCPEQQALLPEQAVVTADAVTYGRGCFPFTYAAEPHDWLNSAGGAIGRGPPLATGAAVGTPGRRVVALQADGSAMYTCRRCGRRRARIWTSPRCCYPIASIRSCWANLPMSAPTPAAPRSTCWTWGGPISTGPSSPPKWASRPRARTPASGSPIRSRRPTRGKVRSWSSC